MRNTRVLSTAARAEEEWYVVEPQGGIFAIPANLARNFRVRLGANSEMRIDAGTSGAEVNVRVEQDATGSWTLTPNASIVFRNGETTIQLNTAANSATMLSFRFDDGAQAFECVTPVSKVRADLLYQPLDATLTAVAGVTTSADKVIYFTGADAAAAASLTSAGRTLIAGVDAGAQRATLGLGTAYAANKAAAQADSTAAVLADLVSDFNSLLGKLRTAGLLTP